MQKKSKFDRKDKQGNEGGAFEKSSGTHTSETCCSKGEMSSVVGGAQGSFKMESDYFKNEGVGGKGKELRGSSCCVVETPTKKETSKKKIFSAEEKYKMIQEAAYYVAEKHGFSGDQHAFWAQAEKEVNDLIAKLQK